MFKNLFKKISTPMIGGMKNMGKKVKDPNFRMDMMSRVLGEGLGVDNDPLQSDFELMGHAIEISKMSGGKITPQQIMAKEWGLEKDD